MSSSSAANARHNTELSKATSQTEKASYISLHHSIDHDINRLSWTQVLHGNAASAWPANSIGLPDYSSDSTPLISHGSHPSDLKGKRKANGEGDSTGSGGRRKKRKKVMLDEDSIIDLCSD